MVHTKTSLIVAQKHEDQQQQAPEGVSSPVTALEGEKLIGMVTRAVSAISLRLNSLAMLEPPPTPSPATVESSPGRSDAPLEQPLNEKVSVVIVNLVKFNTFSTFCNSNSIETKTKRA